MSDLINKLRKRKVAGIAVFDVAGSVLMAVLIARRYQLSKLKMAVGVLMLGEVVHVALGISTPVTRKMLGEAS
jgi:hypothetical protein